MSVSVLIIRGILSELCNRGVDPDELLRAIELPRELLMDMHGYVTSDQAGRLVRDAIDRTGDPGLGLTIGTRAPLAMLQIFGHLISAHRTLREAVAAWQRCSILLADAARFGLLEQGELALFTCESPGTSASARFFIDLTLALALRIGRQFTAPTGQLREVRVRHSAPMYTPRYHELFECAVRFEQEHNALVFPRALLDRPQLHADATVRWALHEVVERLLQGRVREGTLSERVRSILQSADNVATLNAVTMAQRLCTSQRSLRRKLKAEGTTFTALFDEVRCRVARTALSRPGSSVKEVSELLKFSEQSAFHRAFKRWTGQTPGAYVRLAAECQLSQCVSRPVEVRAAGARPH